MNEIEQFFHDHFGKLPEEVKADLGEAKARLDALETSTAARLATLEGFIKAHAAQGAQVAKLAEQIVEAADPAAAPAVAALASTARTVAEKGQKLLEDITSKL